MTLHLFACHPERVTLPKFHMSEPSTATRSQADGTVRILVLDDDPTIADIMTRMLKALTYQPRWVKTGEEAIQACKEAANLSGFYDAALLDLTIHDGMGGREALKEMLKIDPKLKGIACSGYSDDELNSQLRAEGFVEILPKPFKSQDLSKMIKTVLALP
jgi:two-component system, cell cycle sensor histidine kinase and response regulator CckA